MGVFRGNLVTTDRIQTLTNKTFDITDNTLTGTAAQFNTAISDADFLTNRTGISLYRNGSLVSCTDIPATNTAVQNWTTLKAVLDVMQAGDYLITGPFTCDVNLQYTLDNLGTATNRITWEARGTRLERTSNGLTGCTHVLAVTGSYLTIIGLTVDGGGDDVTITESSDGVCIVESGTGNQYHNVTAMDSCRHAAGVSNSNNWEFSGTSQCQLFNCRSINALQRNYRVVSGDTIQFNDCQSLLTATRSGSIYRHFNADGGNIKQLRISGGYWYSDLAQQINSVFDPSVSATDEVTNGAFATDTNWTKEDAVNITISGGTANWSGGQSVAVSLSQVVTETGDEWKEYFLTFTLSAVSAGTLQVRLAEGPWSETFDTSGAKIVYRLMCGDTHASGLEFEGDADFIGSLDSVVLKERKEIELLVIDGLTIDEPNRDDSILTNKHNIKLDFIDTCVVRDVKVLHSSNRCQFLQVAGVKNLHVEDCNIDGGIGFLWTNEGGPPWNCTCTNCMFGKWETGGSQGTGTLIRNANYIQYQLACYNCRFRVEVTGGRVLAYEGTAPDDHRVTFDGCIIDGAKEVGADEIYLVQAVGGTVPKKVGWCVVRNCRVVGNASRTFVSSDNNSRLAMSCETQGIALYGKNVLTGGTVGYGTTGGASVHPDAAASPNDPFPSVTGHLGSRIFNADVANGDNAPGWYWDEANSRWQEL